LKKITFYQTIRRDALVSISKGLDLESVTFDHSCNNHCSGEDLREFLEEQQETLKVNYHFINDFINEIFLSDSHFSEFSMAVHLSWKILQWTTKYRAFAD